MEGGGGGGYRGGRNNNYGGGGGGHHKRKFQGGGGADQRYSQQRRDADEGGDGTRPLLAKLIKCADVPRPQGAAPLEEEVVTVSKELRRELDGPREETLRRFLLDCGIEIAYKAPIYATLAGALNAWEPRFGALLAEDARAAVEAAASSSVSSSNPGGGGGGGGSDRHRLRLSVRWVACLTTTGVVSPVSAVALLRSLVDAASAVADANSSDEGEGDEGKKKKKRKRHAREWQPYSDDLVYCALSALPWCGKELGAAAPGELQGLEEAARAYASRSERRNFSPGLAPYFASPPSAASGDVDPAAAAAFASCDSGGASFLAEVLEATGHETRKGRERAWSLPSVPWPAAASPALESVLTSGSAAPHALSPPVVVPIVPPVLASLGLGGGDGDEEEGNDDSSSSSVAVRGAALLAAYPPRGRLALLPRLGPDGRPPPSSSSDANWKPAHALSGWALLCAEDAVADTARSFDGDRVQCARRLALALPHVPLASSPVELEVGDGEGGTKTVSVTPTAGAEALLAETLLAAMVRPPAPDLKPLAYSALLVDCCLALPTAFPRAMSGCVREIFARCGALDPYVSRAAADWLAYHLSNFEFAWPWAKWESAVLPPGTVPAHDPKRRFVSRLIDDLVRLSYWERVRSALPESFHALMPPQPVVAPLEDDGDAGDDEDEEEEDEEALEEGEDSGEESLFSLDAGAAREVLELARRKAPPSALTEWASSRAASGVWSTRLVASALRALFVAGAKSFTHMVTVLERYHDFLSPLISSCPGDQGEMAALRAAARAWRSAPQRGAQAVDRLMAARLVSGASVVRWALSSRGFLRLPSSSSSSPSSFPSSENGGGGGGGEAQTLAWDALHIALDKLAARAADAAADAAGAKGAAVDAAEAADAAEERAAVSAAAENEAAEGATPPPSEAAAAATAAAPGNAAAAPLRAAAAAALDLADLKAQEHAQALETQRAALALALTMMRDALSRADAAAASSGAPDGVPPERLAWRAHTLATLRAFVRRYHAAIAPIAESVVRGEIFAEGRPAPSDARAAVLVSLEM